MASNLYLVDTSAWIFALRERPIVAIRDRVSQLLGANAVATTGIVVLELLGGTRDQEEFEKLRRRLGGLHYLPIEDHLWERAAGMAWRLRRRGVTAPFTDVLIATVALENEAVVLHADSDFDLVAQHEPLKVESFVRMVRKGPN